ncbi:leucine-rich repeat and WD repeat-containing protein 1-like [Cloeon dipterum]|uniref:leucine-rich repeat and WD repeat-containing protein 1-like n=1 Tax=Cloeon dipterum TaxID=197152 RepID=UPI00322046F3
MSPGLHTEIDGQVFRPVEFLRVHSIDDNKSDIQTEIWHSAFQPDLENPGKLTFLLATCGGNSVCITDVKTSTVKYKFKAEIGEKLFSLAWGTNLSHSVNSILAVGGTGKQIYFISPNDSSVEAAELSGFTNLRGKQRAVVSLIFHPSQLDVLFCGFITTKTSQILVTQFDPSKLSNLKVLHKLSCPDSLIQADFHVTSSTLFCAHDRGLHAWDLDCNLSKIDDDRSEGYSVTLPQPMDKTIGMLHNSTETMVDSVLSLRGTSMVAYKIVTFGCIVIFDVSDAEMKNKKLEPKSFLMLEHDDSNDAYLYLGWEPEKKILACGDGSGGVWVYNLANLNLNSDITFSTPPSTILKWPKLKDEYVEIDRKVTVGCRNRKQLSNFVTHVSMNQDYLVSVTRTNFICVWKGN